MATTIKNKFGTLIGWNNVKLNLLGRDVEGIDEIEYEDELDLDNAYGGGNYPIGETVGNYKAKGSISLYMEENMALQKSLPKGVRIQEIPAFDIPVVFEYNGEIYKDVLRNCRFKTNGRQTKNGEGKIVFKHELKVGTIDWNV